MFEMPLTPIYADDGTEYLVGIVVNMGFIDVS